MSTPYQSIQIKRTESSFSDANSPIKDVVPKFGEFVYSKYTSGNNTTHRLIIGDGSSTLSSLDDSLSLDLGILGQIKNLPVPVGQGGTGLSTSPSMLINLESTATDDILKSSPRPGVTGVLPVINGGTGVSVLTGSNSLRSAIGLGTDSDVLAVANGGTGASSFTSGAALIGAGTGAVITRTITNNTSATVAAEDTNLVTNNTLYYATASINNARQTSAVSVYAPTTAGTTNQILVSAGGTSAPVWKATANGAAYATSTNGSLTFGTLPVAQGGTGQTTLNAAANSFINGLSVGDGAISSGECKIITQVAAATTDNYYRRPASLVKVGGLLTPRTLKVNLSSTSASTGFDGTANISDIGVSGTLAVTNGGTGRSSLPNNSSIPCVTVASTAPNSPSKGDMYFNSDTSVLWIYTGSAWQSVVGVWG